MSLSISRPTPEGVQLGLSRRELEVTCLVGQGLNNREIAGRLNVSRRTADHHVSNILRKLDAPNRAVAVLTAERQGILGASLLEISSWLSQAS